MTKVNKFKVNRRRRRFASKNTISIADLRNKNYDRLLILTKYIEYLNLLPRRKINLWIENIKLSEKINKKTSFRKIYWVFKRSKKELKRLYFVLKKIERKRLIRTKRKLFNKKICFVMFKKTNKNFFVTVIDIAGNVITYASAGMFSNFNNSKKKILFF